MLFICKRKVGYGVLAGLLILAVMVPVSATADKPARAGNYHFLVEIDGMVVGQFVSVSGLSVEQEVIEFREGGDPGVTRKIPGPVKYGNITLKRGVTDIDDDYFSNWIRVSFDPAGAVDRRDGTLILVDQRGREVSRWNFTNGWPSKWDGPTLGGSSNEIATEEITITVEKIEMD